MQNQMEQKLRMDVVEEYQLTCKRKMSL